MTNYSQTILPVGLKLKLIHLVQTAFAGEEFLERNRDDLYTERLPYFGKAVMDHAHFAAWGEWAHAQGLPPAERKNFRDQVKDFVKKMPTLRR